jgi:hypothetical protein
MRLAHNPGSLFDTVVVPQQIYQSGIFRVPGADIVNIADKLIQQGQVVIVRCLRIEGGI